MMMLLIGAALIFVIYLYTNFSYSTTYKSDFFLESKSKCELYCSENEKILEEQCEWYFYNYTPSAWESIWYGNINTLQNSVCETLSTADNVNKSVLFMQRLIELQKFGRNKTNTGYSINDELLSRMFYRQRCIDSRSNTFVDVVEVSQLIEPLIGLLRDPLTICSALDASRVPPSLYDGAILLSRRNLLLSVSAPYYINFLTKEHRIISAMDSKLNNLNNPVPPWMYMRSTLNSPRPIREKGDRKILLFDLGSSYYGRDVDVSETSTRWFYEYYKRVGVQFDRIIAFEAALLNPTVAWEQLPDDVFPIYSLINSGCAEKGIFNPWITLKRLAKLHDYVVVKIDIDSFGIENFLINQVVNDSSIHSLIDELFFEHHVSVREMLRYWRPPPGTLQDSYILFTKLRQLGIRMHSWP
jgi:hypothetical protein